MFVGNCQSLKFAMLKLSVEMQMLFFYVLFCLKISKLLSHFGITQYIKLDKNALSLLSTVLAQNPQKQ